MFMTHELVIIGSGPAGLTAALYAARAELQPVLVAGLTPGGQLTQTTEVENFPGFPEGIQGPELMQNMIKQVERFGTQMVYESVQSVDFSGQPLLVKTDTQEFHAKAVIIATGADANWLNLPNEQRLRGKGVSACATCDGFFFKGKEVVVVGGGDSAMEEANFLTKFATQVTIVHRREEFKASKIMLKRAQDNPKISFRTNVTITDVLGESAVTGIRIKHNETGAEEEIACQGYFAAIGHTPATKVFAASGIEINEKGYIVPKDFTQTSIPGVFVAGDVHDHRYRQAITAAGEGCKAALDAEKWLQGQG
ncbi:MAG: thioredoxin-disulfide reductase [Candidatus Doudnabacteria bacterium]|nr:thioredoxin-disulfide reductase [Candidatus Doudnabacteria bacterium]